jgi:hypothetical protein
MATTKNNHNELISKNNHKERPFYEGIELERERQHRVREEEELKRCGVKTSRRKREVSDLDMVTVIPVGEIEVSDELDSFVKNEILDGWNLTYPEWIRGCYIQRVAQILNDPAEFGKVVLQGKIRDHCIQKSDLEGCIDD